MIDPAVQASTLTKALKFHKTLAESPPSSWKTLDPKDYALAPNFPPEFHLYQSQAHVDRLVFRVAARVSSAAELLDWYTALNSVSLRRKWDQHIADVELISSPAPNIHLVKHLYKIGWVTSVRELNLISTTLSDQSSVLHVAASLPADPDHRLSIASSAASASLVSWSVHKVIADEADASMHSNSYDLNVFWSWDLKYWSAGLGYLEPPVYIPKLITNLLAFFPVFAKSSPLVTDFGESIDLRSAQAYDQVNSANPVFTCEYRVNLSSHRDALLRDIMTKVKSDIGISLSKNPTRQGRVVIFLGPADTAWTIDLHVEREGSGVLGWKAAVEDNARHAFMQLKIDHDIPKSQKDYLTVSVRIARKDQGKDILVNGRKVKIQAEDDPTAEKRRGEYLNPLLPLAINSTQLDATAFSERSMIDTSSRQLVQERIQAAYKSILQYHSTPSSRWKEMQPFRGVTLAQLPIPGKPLGVLKRQTTCDASLWDTAAAIIHAQSQWDDAWVESLTILGRLNEQCRLLYLKTKGTWPISSRDMVLAQTMTSSSKAIYIYSVSIDDIPLSTELQVPAASKVLRAKVDLFGWVIDHATAKQCRVSQYALADWKGWGSTSSLYQPFWNSISNAVNYSASYGGPPILTQFTNASLMRILFEHDKSIMRVEYKTDFANESQNPDDDTVVRVTQSTAEFRINTLTWSRDAEMLINPHPYGIQCIRKPRDNGIWVTIQHTDVAMGSGKVAVVIRRGAEHTGKDTVIINGTKYAAENASTNVAEGPTKKNPAAAGISKIDGLAFKTASSEHLDTASVLSVAAQSRILDPYSATESSAHSQSSNQSASSKILQPMEIAFQALEAVNTLHREDDTGWTSLAARKGIKMAKKIDAGVSPTIPIMRGEMVIEGFDADEILSVITSFSARKEWDDTFDEGQVLQSYGSGCSTSLLTFKSPLAFFQVKGREMQIASVAARFVQDATAAPSSPTVPNALYVAGASFTRNTTIPRLNILTNVLLDGWILENVDPYTMTTNYAIPSTRVTRIECVDYGALTYLQSMVTSTVPKVLLGISSYLKNHGPTPYTVQPSAYIQVVEGLQSSRDAVVDYEVDELDQAKDLLDGVFSQERSTYRACVQLDVVDAIAASRLRAWKTSIQNLEKNASRNGLPDTPSGTRSRLISTTSRPQSIVDSPLNRSTINVVTASPARPERRASISSLSSRKSQQSTAANTQVLDDPDDFVVLDLLLDAKRYPKGFSVATYSYSPQKSDSPLILPASLDLDDLPAPLNLPLATDVYEITAPPSYAASLNGSAPKPFKYLVRMTLPAIVDLESKATLTSLDRGWWQSLIGGKCVIDARISPNEGDHAVLVDGEVINVSQELPPSFHHNALVSGQVDDDAADNKLPSALRLRRITRNDLELSNDHMHIPDVYSTPRAVSASVTRDLDFAKEASMSLATPTSATFNQRSISGRSVSTIAGANTSASDFDDTATEIAGSGDGHTVANHRQRQGDHPSGNLFDMASEGASQLTAAVQAAVDRKSSVPIIVAILVAILSIYIGMKINDSIFAKSAMPTVYVGAGHVQTVNEAVGDEMQVKALRFTLKLFGWDIVIARAA